MSRLSINRLNQSGDCFKLFYKNIGRIIYTNSLFADTIYILSKYHFGVSVRDIKRRSELAYILLCDKRLRYPENIGMPKFFVINPFSV